MPGHDFGNPSAVKGIDPVNIIASLILLLALYFSLMAAVGIYHLSHQPVFQSTKSTIDTSTPAGLYLCAHLPESGCLKQLPQVQRAEIAAELYTGQSNANQ